MSGLLKRSSGTRCLSRSPRKRARKTLRSKGVGNFNRDKTVVLEDPDNADTVFLVELENDDGQGRGQGQQEQLEIKISEEMMQALLDQARNQQLTTDEEEEGH